MHHKVFGMLFFIKVLKQKAWIARLEICNAITIGNQLKAHVLIELFWQIKIFRWYKCFDFYNFYQEIFCGVTQTTKSIIASDSPKSRYCWWRASRFIRMPSLSSVCPKQSQRSLLHSRVRASVHSGNTHHWSEPLGMKCRKHWHVKGMHSWVGLVCHPKQSKGRIDSELQPPPPGDDLPSLLNDRVLDHGWAGPKLCGPYPAMRQ